MHRDAFVSEALAQTSDQAILPSPPLPNETRILVHPIRSYNDKLGTFETLGAAKVIFSEKQAIGSLSDMNYVLAIFVTLTVAFSIGLGLLLSNAVQTPLDALAEKIHLWRTGQSVERSTSSFLDFRTVYDALDRAIEDKRR